MNTSNAWELLRRRGALALVVLLLVGATVVSAVLGLPRIYQTTAVVLVEHPQVAESLAHDPAAQALNVRLRTISERVLSRARLIEIIDRFSLYPDVPHELSREGQVKRMRDDILLEMEQAESDWGKNSTVAFSLTYRATDPHTAAQVANVLAGLFVEENTQRRVAQASASEHLLQSQLEQVEARLREHEKRIGQYKERHMGALPEQVSANLATLERLNARLTAIQERQTALREMQARRPRPDGSSATSALSAEDPWDRLEQLQEELERKSASLGSKHPDIIDLEESIAALRKRLEGTARKTDKAPDKAAESPGASSSTQSELRALQQEAAALESQIASYQARVESAPRHEQELAQLLREYETMKTYHGSLLERDEQAVLAGRVEQEGLGERFQILDEAVLPTAPAPPARPLLLLFGIGFAVAAACAAGFTAERLDGTFLTVDQLRRFTSVPVLASVPTIVTPTDQWRASGRLALNAGAVVVVTIVLALGAFQFAEGNVSLAMMLVK